MATTTDIPLSTSLALSVIATERVDGDFGVHRGGVEQRRRALVEAPWTWLRLEHGATVVHVVEPGDNAGANADAAVTSTAGAPLSVTTADCAPVVMAVLGQTGTPAIAVVHAGWRGLVSGVIEAAAAALEGLAGPVAQARTSAAWCGPCIGPEDYAFSPPDLAHLVDRYGPVVASTTRDGGSALDLFAGVREALAGVGFDVATRPRSTAGRRYFSHRLRADSARMATVARLVTRPAEPEGHRDDTR